MNNRRVSGAWAVGLILSLVVTAGLLVCPSAAGIVFAEDAAAAIGVSAEAVDAPAAGASPEVYAAFTSSYAATMYLPGTKIIRIQPVRTYLDRAKPMVALTFDDGPAQYTESIVDLLGRYGGRATFCVLGSRVKKQPDRVRAAAAQGSEIIGHSWDHKDLTALPMKKIRADLRKTNNAIRAVTGVRPSMYRPPYGTFDKAVRKASKKQKLALLTWSVDTRDWELRNAKKLFKVIRKEAKDGQIILMHDIHEPTAESMEKAIPWLVEQGYELVTVSEMFYYKGIEVKPGKVYNGRA